MSNCRRKVETKVTMSGCIVVVYTCNLSARFRADSRSMQLIRSPLQDREDCERSYARFGTQHSRRYTVPAAAPATGLRVPGNAIGLASARNLHFRSGLCLQTAETGGQTREFRGRHETATPCDIRSPMRSGVCSSTTIYKMRFWTLSRSVTGPAPRFEKLILCVV